jgi:hypothetical protein
MLEAVEDGLAPIDEYLPALHQQTQTLASLIDDLFELARIDAGALTLELREAQLPQLVSHCVSGLEADARARQIRLESQLDDALPDVRCASTGTPTGRSLQSRLSFSCRRRRARRRGLPSQDAIQLSSDGRYLLAADAGSNQISVLRVGFNGVPQPVGAPVSSGGGEPLSIAVSGNLVYVANAGANAPNITGFTLAPNGSLNPLPGSTVSLPAGSGPDDVLIDPRGRRLVVDLDNTSTIASFHVLHDGSLVLLGSTPFGSAGAAPLMPVCLPTAGRCW